MDSLFTLCTAAATLLLAIYVFFYNRRHRRHYAPLAGSIFHQVLNFDRLHDYHTDISSKHRTFRIFAPFRHQVYSVDPVIIEHILKTNFAKYGKGWFNYENMEGLFGDGIFAVDGDKWRHQRKIASHEFSTKVLRDCSSTTFKTNAAKLARIVSQMSISGRPMDIQDLFLKSTMESIFKIGFGVELNSLDGSNEKGNRFAKAFDDASVSIPMRYVDMFWKIKKYLNIGLEASLKKNIKLVDDFVYDIILAKIEKMSSQQNDSEKKDDILSRFLEESKKDPENMTHKYLRDIILNFLIAGKDTTAGTLAWFIYMLCKHPAIQEKLAREMDEAMKAHHTSDFDEFASSITDASLDKMQYLHATLSETLRLYPAVPLESKVCLADDTLPGGFDVRKGDIVFYQPYAMGRLKFLWGDNAETFRPERWIDDNGMFRPESPFKFTAFQAGPRICLGKEFAYRQMKIFAAVLLHFFRFELSDVSKAVRYRTMITLHIDQGLHVYAFPR